MINKKAYMASKCTASIQDYTPEELDAIAKFLGIYDKGIMEQITVDFSTSNFPIEVDYSYHEAENNQSFHMDLQKYADIVNEHFNNDIREYVYEFNNTLCPITFVSLSCETLKDNEDVYVDLNNKSNLLVHHIESFPAGKYGDDYYMQNIVSDFNMIKHAIINMIRRASNNLELDKSESLIGTFEIMYDICRDENSPDYGKLIKRNKQIFNALLYNGSIKIIINDSGIHVYNDTDSSEKKKLLFDGSFSISDYIDHYAVIE